MSAKPWMKFFPSDWRGDVALRSCSLAARGLWLEMLTVMDQSEPRGSLLINGNPVSTKELAILAGAKHSEVVVLLAKLGDAGIYSTDQDGTIYSRKMRRDARKAEEDKQNGKRGGNPKLLGGVNPQDMPSDNGPDKAQWNMASGSGVYPSLPSQGKDLVGRGEGYSGAGCHSASHQTHITIPSSPPPSQRGQFERVCAGSIDSSAGVGAGHTETPPRPIPSRAVPMRAFAL